MKKNEFLGYNFINTVYLNSILTHRKNFIMRRKILSDKEILEKYIEMIKKLLKL